ncbi:TlpA disulfide reductase family protein [Aliikangiella maris]
MTLIIVFISQLSFMLPTKAIEITDYKGKVLYLDFWASWCIPCRKSFPWMNDLREKYSEDELAIVAVNLDKDKSLAQDFLEKYPASFSIAYDPEGKLAKKYQIPGMPSTIIFDKNGKVVDAHSGFFAKKIPEYEAKLEAIIKK